MVSLSNSDSTVIISLADGHQFVPVCSVLYVLDKMLTAKHRVWLRIVLHQRSFRIGIFIHCA